MLYLYFSSLDSLSMYITLSTSPSLFIDSFCPLTVKVELWDCICHAQVVPKSFSGYLSPCGRVPSVVLQWWSTCPSLESYLRWKVTCDSSLTPSVCVSFKTDKWLYLKLQTRRITELTNPFAVPVFGNWFQPISPTVQPPPQDKASAHPPASYLTPLGPHFWGSTYLGGLLLNNWWSAFLWEAYIAFLFFRCSYVKLESKSQRYSVTSLNGG